MAEFQWVREGSVSSRAEPLLNSSVKQLDSQSNRILEQGFARAENAFRELDRKRTTVIGARITGERKHVLAIIAKPTPSEYGKYLDALKQAFASVPEDLDRSNLVEDRKAKLLSRYTTFDHAGYQKLIEFIYDPKQTDANGNPALYGRGNTMSKARNR